MQYTKALSEYATNLKFEDLPKEVVEQAKLLTLQTLGVSVAASVTEQGEQAIALAKELGGGSAEASIAGDGERVSCAMAAFVNGTLADLLDWEDCSWTGHPSAGAIPAALAVGEKTNCTGKQFLTAVVAGYEVYQRIAMAVQQSDSWSWMTKGWGLTTWQVFSAAIPAAKLLELDSLKMAQTIGVAGANSAVVNAKYMSSRSDLYHYNHGTSCMNGVVAAHIAKAGVTGMYDFLDGRDDGYWVSVSDQCDWDWFTKDLSNRYLIMDTLFKHWPSNMWVQQPLDATQEIMKEARISADDIESVVVSPNFSFIMLPRPNGWDGNLDAEFSIPFGIASMVLDPEPGPNWYTEERYRDARVISLATKVRGDGPTMGPRDAFKLFWAGEYPVFTVEIVMKSGQKHVKTNRLPKGHPKNRLTTEEFAARFRRAASFGMDPGSISKAIDLILDLENVASLGEVGRLLHRPL